MCGWCPTGLLGGARYSNMDVLCCDNMFVRSHGRGSVQKKSWLRASSESILCFGSSQSSLSIRSRAYWSLTYPRSLSFTLLFWPFVKVGLLISGVLRHRTTYLREIKLWIKVIFSYCGPDFWRYWSTQLADQFQLRLLSITLKSWKTILQNFLRIKFMKLHLLALLDF